MEQITLSIEQMNQLKKLGLDTSDASMCWSRFINDLEYMLNAFSVKVFKHRVEEYDKLYGVDSYNIIPTYTLQDIVNKLPQGNINNQTNELIITHNYTAYKGYTVGGYNCPHIEYGDPLISAYNMLLWCIKNNYVKTNKV